MTDAPEDATAAGTQMLASLGIKLNPEEDAPAEEEFGPIEVAEPTALITSPPHFAVPTQVLVTMINQVMEVVPTRDIIPALRNIVLDVTEDQLVMTGSDSTSTVYARTTAVRVTRPGRLLIGAVKFATIVRRAVGPEVDLRTEDQMLNIVSGASAWAIRVSISQEYARLPEVGDLTWHDVDREQFERAVRAVRFAASSDDNDPARQQLYFSHGLVTSTDRKLFAQAEGMVPPGLVCEMPTYASDLLMKMLDRNESKELRIADTEFHIVAEIGPPESADRMVVAHIAEEFPTDALNAFQTPLAENRDELAVNGEDLLEALRRAVPTSDEDTGAIALRVGTPDPQHVTVASKNRYHEVASEVIEAQFSRPGSEAVPAPRSVLLHHTRLAQAIRAVNAISPDGDDDTPAGTVIFRLGMDRSQSRRAFVLMENVWQDSGSVRIVISQGRSDFL